MRALALAALVMVLTAAAATAQAPGQIACGVRDQMVEVMQQKYGEQQRVVGVTREGGLMEIWAAAAGNFTALMTAPNGISCVLTTGQGFKVKPPAPDEPEVQL